MWGLKGFWYVWFCPWVRDDEHQRGTGRTSVRAREGWSRLKMDYWTTYKPWQRLEDYRRPLKRTTNSFGFGKPKWCFVDLQVAVHHTRTEVGLVWLVCWSKDTMDTHSLNDRKASCVYKKNADNFRPTFVMKHKRIACRSASFSFAFCFHGSSSPQASHAASEQEALQLASGWGKQSAAAWDVETSRRICIWRLRAWSTCNGNRVLQPWFI